MKFKYNLKYIFICNFINICIKIKKKKKKKFLFYNFLQILNKLKLLVKNFIIIYKNIIKKHDLNIII